MTDQRVDNLLQRLDSDELVQIFLNEARPCPFCGGQDLGSTDWWDDDGDFLAVHCRGCKAEAPATVWNRREGS